jgi:hypothetical protein
LSPCEAVAARSDVRRDLRLADRQAIDAGLRGERLDGPKTGRLGFAVVADGVLRAGVLPVFVTVGGVVFGDAVDVGKLHAAIFRHRDHHWR